VGPDDLVKTCPSPYAFPAPFIPNRIPPFELRLADFKWDRQAISDPSIYPRSCSHPIDIVAFSLDFQTRLKLSDKPTLKRKRVGNTMPWSQELGVVCPSEAFLATASTFREGGDTSSLRPRKRRHVALPRKPPCQSVAPLNCGTPSISDSLPSSSKQKNFLFSRLTQHFFSQRLDWRTSKFVEWSSIPNLTLNCFSLDLPFVH